MHESAGKGCGPVDLKIEIKNPILFKKRKASGCEQLQTVRVCTVGDV